VKNRSRWHSKSSPVGLWVPSRMLWKRSKSRLRDVIQYETNQWTHGCAFCTFRTEYQICYYLRCLFLPLNSSFLSSSSSRFEVKRLAEEDFAANNFEVKCSGPAAMSERPDDLSAGETRYLHIECLVDKGCQSLSYM